MKVLRVLSVAAVMATVSGCSSMFSIGQSDFSCTGFGDEEGCQSARDIYEATAKTSYDSDGSTGDGSEKGGGKVQGDRQWNVKVDDYVAPPVPNKPVPIREPAKVMRIWMAPWEDESGDLHVSSYVYTEIEKRKWAYGNRTDTRSNNTKSLQRMSSPPRLGGSGTRGNSGESEGEGTSSGLSQFDSQDPDGNSGFGGQTPTERDLDGFRGNQ